MIVASIAEIVGADGYVGDESSWGARPHVARRRRWITTTTDELVIGDVTRSAGSWQRTVARLTYPAGRVLIEYVDGSTQALRPAWYVTVDAGVANHRKRRRR